MAALPTAVSSNVSNDLLASPATPNGTTTPQRSVSLDFPKQNLRGLNKPKCIKCGNVARSRCPFQSCKGCCAKAQNPCYIHVLKQTSTLPDKPPPSSSPLPEQPSTDTPSKGAAQRLSSLRQLSSTFANSLRTKRPLSRKDAININKWRFAKLREYIDENIEAENEAFDRYLRNVSLLEETFFVDKTLDGLTAYGLPELEPSLEDDFEKSISAIKAMLHADRAENNRERIQSIVDQGLNKLQKWEFACGDEEGSHSENLDSHRELNKRRKVNEWRTERTAAVNDLVDKLTKVRTEDELKSCIETKLKLYNQDANKNCQTSTLPVSGEVQETKQRAPNPVQVISSYSLPNLCTRVQIDEDALSNIEAQISSLDQIIQL